MTNEPARKKTRKKATPVESALQRRRTRQQNRDGNAIADWETLDSESVLKLVGIVTALKGTVTFGYTRDGGAYYVNYYVDSESEKVYIRPTEDVNARILDEIECWK
jgi:hypothetical protein